MKNITNPTTTTRTARASHALTFSKKRFIRFVIGTRDTRLSGWRVVSTLEVGAWGGAHMQRPNNYSYKRILEEPPSDRDRPQRCF